MRFFPLPVLRAAVVPMWHLAVNSRCCLCWAACPPTFLPALAASRVDRFKRGMCCMSIHRQLKLAAAGRELRPQWIPEYPSTWTLRIVWGPQDGDFTDKGKRIFTNTLYAVSPQSDRTGIRLNGPGNRQKKPYGRIDHIGGSYFGIHSGSGRRQTHHYSGEKPLPAVSQNCHGCIRRSSLTWDKLSPEMKFTLQPYLWRRRIAR